MSLAPQVTLQQAFELAFQHHQAGRLAEAEAIYRQILVVQPNHFESLHHLGVLAHQFSRDDLAVEWIRRAILANPNIAAAHYNLGNALRDRWQPEEAIVAYRRALTLQPNFPEACNNLGNVLRGQGQFDEAIAAFREALTFQPNHTEAHLGLGTALMDRGQLDEATAAIRRALALRPDLAGAHNNLGNALKDQGRLDEAIAAYRHSLALDPAAVAVRSNLIHTLHFHPGQNDAMIAEERQRWNRQVSGSLPRVIRPQANDRDPERRLRIGYVSPEFRENVVGRNLLPLFQHHDHRDFEVLCYAGTAQPDGFTEEFCRRAALWRSTAGVADDALAEMIRQDGVDILVDLTQHLAGNRLPVFARQPAPVQVSFAGYPESTGVEAIEYRISDRWMESEMGVGSWEIGWKHEPELRSSICPHGTADFSQSLESELRAEQVFLLDSFWCYDPRGPEIEINGLPARESGGVTFGSLNNFCKVNDLVLKLWARVLREVKESRLAMLSGFGSHRQRTVEFLEREGVAANRVEFVEPRLHRAYLALYHRLDVVLDTFPYNGHSTSLDALWMGVPVVSLAGQSAVSRAGLSQLSNLELPELVAFSEDEFVEIATRLAGDLSRLAELRRTLRSRMEASVLMDAPRFTRNIEAAYRAMWRRWCMEKTGA